MNSALFPTTGNATPAGGTVGLVTTPDGLSLRVARWRPSSRKLRGTVVLIQGRAECIEKSFETITDLRRRGFHVLAFDWRGQGGSDRLLPDARKGHVDDFSDYVTDLSAVLTQAASLEMPQPWFGLAHSMGGAATLLALHAGEKRLSRVVLTAPLCGIADLRVPALARTLAVALDLLGLGGSYIPSGSATSISTRLFETNRLTSDASRYARIGQLFSEAPQLAIGDPTIGWVSAMFRAFARFEAQGFGENLTVPTLFITSGADRLVSTPAAMRLSSRIRASGAIEIRGAKHEVMNETPIFRDRFWAAFDAFIPGEMLAETQAA
jgi:lysophospholipase